MESELFLFVLPAQLAQHQHGQHDDAGDKEDAQHTHAHDGEGIQQGLGVEAEVHFVGGLGFAVPVPGGIGAFHYVISLALFGVYGIPMEMGIIYATLSHTAQAITQILFGAGSYAYEAIKK